MSSTAQLTPLASSSRSYWFADKHHCSVVVTCSGAPQVVHIVSLAITVAEKTMTVVLTGKQAVLIGRALLDASEDSL